MNNNNQHVLLEVNRWLRDGHSVWLGTVVKTWGSSPRPVGSLMACVPGVGLCGSLSGGCIEEYLLEQLTESSLQRRAPLLKNFGGTEAEQEQFQLPCGGQLLVCLEYLEPDVEVINHFRDLLQYVSQRETVTRTVGINDGALTLERGSGLQELQLDDQRLSHPLTPDWRMLLTGCGEVTRCVAELAMALEFSVTICDFRSSFTEGWTMPGTELYTGFPDDLIRQGFSDRHCAIITLAHDPRVDDMALMAALDTEAFYVGAMGSSRTSQKRRERLRQLDIPDSQIDQLHAPAGYATGSKTPWEIAISVMAEVIAERKKAVLQQSACHHGQPHAA
ncbi:MAG: XdhC family protein [Endozoicomonas sp.]